MNEQPWRFLIAEKDDKNNFEKLLQTLNEGNQIWAKSASILILTMTKLYFDQSNRQNKHSLYDLGNAVAQLTFQATAMNLYVRQMGGFDIEKAKTIFAVPENFQPVSVLAVGYKGSIESLPEPLKIRELSARKRKEISEIAFVGEFGKPLNIEAEEKYFRKVC